MALTHEDFLLSDEQLAAINRHFAKQSAAYAAANEVAMSGVKVAFEWVPGFGRFVTANFDGEANGLEIEGFEPPGSSKA